MIASCSIAECDSPSRANKFCSKHYQRYQKYGSPYHIDRTTSGGVDDTIGEAGIRNRAWDKIAFEPNTGCWLWYGTVHRQSGGYGSLRVEGKFWSVHRYFYEILVGTIGDGLELDHLCEVRVCCNPDHLEQVTPDENKRRRAARRKTCANGLHPWADGTYLVTPKGNRLCKKCATNANKRKDLAKKLKRIEARRG